MRHSNALISLLALVVVGCAGAAGSTEEATGEVGTSCGSPVALSAIEAGDELVVAKHPARPGDRYLKQLHIGENSDAFEAVRHAEGARDPGQTIEGTYVIARPRCPTSDRALELTMAGETARFTVAPQADGSLRFEGEGYGTFTMTRGTHGGDAGSTARDSDAGADDDGGHPEAGEAAAEGEFCSGTDAGSQCAPGLVCGLYDTPGAGGVCIKL